MVYEKEHLLIAGQGKYPGYSFWQVAGKTIHGKDKGEANGEARQQTCGAFCLERGFGAVLGAGGHRGVLDGAGDHPQERLPALVYLVISLLAVAVVFFVLGAPFAAALEVVVYAGAIVVLFLFVVMMLNLGRSSVLREGGWLRPTCGCSPASSPLFC